MNKLYNALVDYIINRATAASDSDIENIYAFYHNKHSSHNEALFIICSFYSLERFKKLYKETAQEIKADY